MSSLRDSALRALGGTYFDMIAWCTMHDVRWHDHPDAETDRDKAIRQAIVAAALASKDFYVVRSEVHLTNAHENNEPTPPNMLVQCPWHPFIDDQPSLSVNLRTGVFKCFGCGRAGHVDEYEAVKQVIGGT